MEFLKWVGSTLLAILGLCTLAGIVVSITLFGTILGAVVLVALVVVLVAVAIKEYFESS